MLSKIVAHLFIGLVTLYRYSISPLLVFFFGERCRHSPTCSVYAIQAIDHHGPWYGLWLTIARLWRCAPWGTFGEDPVPLELKSQCWYRPWDCTFWTKSGMKN